MKDLIFDILATTPNLTGREIAKILGKDKKEINSFLDKNKNLFIKDEEYRWCNYERKSEQETIILFPSGWVDARKFETILSDHPDLFNKDEGIRFSFKCRGLLLDAIISLLCLANQLCIKGKKITFDFHKYSEVYNYLNRLGFFKHLQDRIVVFPSKPSDFLSNQYNGNSKNLVEMFEVCHLDDSNQEVNRISNLIKSKMNEQEQIVLLPKLDAFIANLIDNVRWHGRSELKGYSALQMYTQNQNKTKIILVIADNGKGLTNTLRLALQLEQYKDIAAHFAKKDDMENTKKLLAYVLNEGGVSRTGDKNRGLGLNEAHRCLQKIPKAETVTLLNMNNIQVKVSIRQESYQISFPYSDKSLEFVDMSSTSNLTKINGTQFVLTVVLTK